MSEGLFTELKWGLIKEYAISVRKMFVSSGTVLFCIVMYHFALFYIVLCICATWHSGLPFCILPIVLCTIAFINPIAFVHLLEASRFRLFLYLLKSV